MISKPRKHPKDIAVNDGCWLPKDNAGDRTRGVSTNAR
jgi:hypothetical protein